MSYLFVFLLFVICHCAFAFDSWHLSDPLDSGLGTPNDALKNVLDVAHQDALDMASVTSLPMEYSIFRGHAAIRDLPDSDVHLLSPETHFQNNNNLSAAWRATAALLLLRGHADAAHEVLLGVMRDNVEEAEFAATHPGQTDWAKQHPLTDSADLLHAAIHRLEGSKLGEGNHTGFENAMYWLAGGPKMLESPASHPVRTRLVQLAKERAPFCVAKGVISRGAEHTIIAGDGATRQVLVPHGEWDGFAFVGVCERRACGELSPKEDGEVANLQHAELALLLKTELESTFVGHHQANTYNSNVTKS